MELKKYKLSDVATVEISNVDKKTKEGESSVKLCNFTDIYYNWAITKEMVEEFMDASASDKQIERFSLKKGQVALTKDSETRYDIGIPTYIADDFENVILGYHCALITPDESKVSGKYLNAFMNSPYIHKYFANSASGSGQRYALSSEFLESMPLLLPSLEKQKHIGELFSDIDRKISLNRAINKNLEALAKQIYDYWFVQFDFPDENGRPYKSSGGKMVWNEKLKREIPETWNVKPLFEAADVQYGFPFSTELFTEEITNIPVVRIRDILDEKYHLHECDVIIGMDGNFHMNFWHDNDAYLNQRCVRIRPIENSVISSTQIYYDLKPYIKAKEANIQGSTVGHLSDKDLKGLYLLSPITNKYFQPRKVLDNLLSMEIHNRQQMLSLKKERDELLPLLMNGQVTIE